MKSRIQPIALGLVLVAVVPYTALKLLWLSGSTVGLSTSATVEEVQGARMVVGNVVTIALELLAVGLAVALIRPWGRRIPAWVVLGLAGGATGLLAPILLGLSIGSLLQLAVRADLRTSGMDEMAPWVFAVTYGGFGLLAIAISVLAWRYALARWQHVLAAPPRPPQAWVVVVSALGMLALGSAMIGWGLLGPGSGGPQSMDAPAQRTTLVVTGLLCVAGWLAPLLGAASRRPHAVWLLTWVGCATAALQGPAQMLLANGGDPTTEIILLALLATPASCLYGLLVLRRRVRDLEGDLPDRSDTDAGPGAPAPSADVRTTAQVGR